MDKKITYTLVLFGTIFIFALVWLFAYGPITEGNPLGTRCIPNTNYVCYGITYNNYTKNTTLTLGQDTGSNWTNVALVFVLLGVNADGNIEPTSVWNSTNVTYIGQLISGKNMQVNLKMYGRNGNYYIGYIWARYGAAAGGQNQFSQIATITVQVN